MRHGWGSFSGAHCMGVECGDCKGKYLVFVLALLAWRHWREGAEKGYGGSAGSSKGDGTGGFIVSRACIPDKWFLSFNCPFLTSRDGSIKPGQTTQLWFYDANGVIKSTGCNY